MLLGYVLGPSRLPILVKRKKTSKGGKLLIMEAQKSKRHLHLRIFILYNFAQRSLLPTLNGMTIKVTRALTYAKITIFIGQCVLI